MKLERNEIKLLTDEQLERNDILDNAVFDLLQLARKNKRFVHVFQNDFDEKVDEIFDGFSVNLTSSDRESIRSKTLEMLPMLTWNESEKNIEWDMQPIAELTDYLESFVPEEEMLEFRPYTEDEED